MSAPVTGTRVRLTELLAMISLGTDLINEQPWPDREPQALPVE